MFWQSACSLSRLNILLRKLNMKHCRGALNMKCGTVQKWKQSKESWGIQSFGWRDKYSVILSNFYELKKLCFMTAKAML